MSLEKILKTAANAAAAIKTAKSVVNDLGGSRSISTTQTKLDEALQWLQAHLMELGAAAEVAAATVHGITGNGEE